MYLLLPVRSWSRHHRHLHRGGHQDGIAGREKTTPTGRGFFHSSAPDLAYPLRLLPLQHRTAPGLNPLRQAPARERLRPVEATINWQTPSGPTPGLSSRPGAGRARASTPVPKYPTDISGASDPIPSGQHPGSAYPSGGATSTASGRGESPAPIIGAPRRRRPARATAVSPGLPPTQEGAQAMRVAVQPLAVTASPGPVPLAGPGGSRRGAR